MTAISPGVQAPAAGPASAVRFSRVLTAEQGPFFVPEDKRAMVCVLADVAGVNAELVVSSSHKTDPVVLSMYNVLRRHVPPIRYETRYTQVSEIAKLYQRHAPSAAGTEDDSERQEQVKTYIREANNMGASDLKIIVVGPYCRIRYTIHGRTRTYHELPAAEGMLLSRALYNTMCAEITGSGLDQNAMQDAQLKADVASQCGLVGSRISTRPANGRGIRIVLRLLPPNLSAVQELEELGYLPDTQVPILREVMGLPFGIALISGITGSGKSTTLKAIIENILRDSDQETDVLTIEDPVEYDIEAEGCTQTPLVYEQDDPDGRRNAWPNALRNAMRQAPKIIVPGEIRDAESAQIAYEAAVTGHFIWSTVHTFDAPSIIDRFRSLGVAEDRLFNPALTVCLANQSLLRRLCVSCRVPYSVGCAGIPSDQRASIEEYCDISSVYLQGPGCEKCNGKTPGVRGRQVAAEIIRTTAEFMEVFRRQGMVAARIYWVKQMGGVTKLAHALHHVHAGLADPRHVIRDVAPLNTDRLHIGV
ncbi:ATPase, T2SS/T4P/T4SS family [Stenotrophomonas maltophilia]|uniref:GspE/PulE family protein n=1 Tax=Stenotrophomonas maltophilia TaxID=40324 RepID=UPI002447FBE3|nr:ATPase, T2SS/T4P/T4SS family [Stenotrophomonas maltophilia]MDH0071208.1 ATPase, T2SS/T4P/T4SS family [Stenotrophomonas maltophilia]MDH0104195.1 ATPase, T2SS/T4P/T4SS family [Stenotrophomonas maltophilia]MDH0330155.1 ATPase, T2SS/T4P/T4SS family [Stenotrophomonas maltophilia]